MVVVLVVVAVHLSLLPDALLGYVLFISASDHSDKQVCYDIETPCDYTTAMNNEQWTNIQTTICGHKKICSYATIFEAGELTILPFTVNMKAKRKKSTEHTAANPISQALSHLKIHNTSLD